MTRDAPTDAAGVMPDPDPRPLPPEPPLPSDCCDSGCSVCVHDAYAEELQFYREQLAAWRLRNPISPDCEPIKPNQKTYKTGL